MALLLLLLLLLHLLLGRLVHSEQLQLEARGRERPPCMMQAVYRAKHPEGRRCVWMHQH